MGKGGRRGGGQLWEGWKEAGWIFLFLWPGRPIALSTWKLTVHGLYFEEEIHATKRDIR
jgi:hypothetical protein